MIGLFLKNCSSIQKNTGFPDEYYDEKYDPEFDQIAVRKVNSSWDTHNSKFAESKLAWVQEFITFCDGLDIKTKEIFLICDRDNLPIDGIGTDESPLLVQGIKVSNSNSIKVHVLSWRRREIKHYLLSYSALGDCIAALNNPKLPEAAHLRQNFNGDYLLENKKGVYQPILEQKEIKKGKNKQLINVYPYNNYLASLSSEFVKNILSPFLEETEEAPYGFNREMFFEYISNIEPDEISEDINYMYNFIIGKL